jgi:hypothetical protein
MTIKSNFIPLELYNKFIGDNFKNKPISIFNDYTPTIEELNINPYNILILNEPNELFKLHDWAIQHQSYFSCILTWGKDVLNQCEHSLLFPFGTTFMHGKDKYKELAVLDKKLEISFICGNKQIIEGHHLRHKIYNNQKHIENIPLKWYYTYDGHKDICFKSSMFHLAIENSQHENFFTEKIIDAFITKTIPIYWGCLNIDKFFDNRGFFTFNTEEEFFNIVNNLTEEEYWSRKIYIDKNYQTAIYYAEYFTRLKDMLNKIIQLNDI